MSVVGSLLVNVSGNNAGLMKAFATATAESNAFAARMEANGARSSGAFKAIGVAGALAAVGIVAFGVEAAKQAASFQSSMELIRTQAHGTQQEVTTMSTAILGLAGPTATAPEDLAAALYHLESAGFRGQVALNALTIAAEGAKVGHANLEDVTNTLDAVLVAGGADAANMAGSMGELNAIVGAGDMHMQDLADAMGTGILASAKTFGLSLKDVGGALATFGDNNIRGSKAAILLRQVIFGFGAPTKAATKALGELGLSQLQLANDMRTHGLTFAMQDLKNHMESSGLTATQQAAVMSEAFGGKKGAAGVMILLQQLERLKSKTEEVGAASGEFASDWAATEATTAFQGQQVAASFDSITLAIGTALLPMVNQLLGAILPVITSISQWVIANPQLTVQLLEMAAGIGALLAAAAFLPGIFVGIGGAIATLLSPVTLVVGAILGLAAHFGLLGKGAQEAFDGMVGTVQAAIPGIISTLEDLAGKFVAWIEPMIPPALAALGRFAGQVIAWIASQVPVVLAQLGAWAGAFIAWMMPMIPPALAALGQFASQIINWIAGQLPVWGAALLDWAGKFIDWVLPMIPPLLINLAKLAATILVWIAQQIPVIAVALGKLALQFVAWVLPEIPKLLGNLAQLAGSLIGWVIGQIPVLETALNKWANAAIKWVLDSIPGLITNLGQWLASVVGWVGSVLATIYNAFLGFGKQIFNGIVDGVKGIGKAIGDLLNQIPGVSIIGGVVSFSIDTANKVINSATSGTGGGAAAGGGGGKYAPPPKPPASSGAIPGGGVREYALGGMVPGTGKQLAYVHGGEWVIPPDGLASTPGPRLPGSIGGGSGQPIVVHSHHHIYLDGKQVAEVTDRGQYNQGTVYGQPLLHAAASR